MVKRHVGGFSVPALIISLVLTAVIIAVVRGDLKSFWNNPGAASLLAQNNTASAADKSTAQKGGGLTVSYIDVGQGDSELIEQGGQCLLIDTGPSNASPKLMSYLKSRKLSVINYLVLTHPHEDHIGNAVPVLKSYKVNCVYMPKITTTTATFRNLLLTFKDKNLKYSQPELLSTFKIGDAVCTVMGPVGTNSKDINTYSIVIKVTYGKTSFLFTGDAQTENETKMLAKGYNLSSDVLKVGHHGSKTSSSKAFLKAVGAKYAVIEAGKGNDYGLPKTEILSRLKAAGMKIYRTDQGGTLVIKSDGSKLTFSR